MRPKLTDDSPSALSAAIKKITERCAFLPFPRVFFIFFVGATKEKEKLRRHQNNPCID